MRNGSRGPQGEQLKTPTSAVTPSTQNDKNTTTNINKPSHKTSQKIARIRLTPAALNSTVILSLHLILYHSKICTFIPFLTSLNHTLISIPSVFCSLITKPTNWMGEMLRRPADVSLPANTVALELKHEACLFDIKHLVSHKIMWARTCLSYSANSETKTWLHVMWKKEAFGRCTSIIFQTQKHAYLI